MEAFFRAAQRVTLVVVASLLIAGCGLFFAPLDGRWNLLDPDVELVSVVRRLEPLADGYVGYDGSRDFGGAELRVRDAKLPYYRSLLRFDWSRAPLYLSSATLKIRCSALTEPPGTVWVYRITGSWEPSDVSWSLATSSTFYDPYGTSMLVTDGGVEYSWDVTALVQTMIERSQQFDFLLVPAGAEVIFESSRGAHPPVLELAGQDVPD